VRPAAAIRGTARCAGHGRPHPAARDERVSHRLVVADLRRIHLRQEGVEDQIMEAAAARHLEVRREEPAVDRLIATLHVEQDRNVESVARVPRSSFAEVPVVSRLLPSLEAEVDRRNVCGLGDHVVSTPLERFSSTKLAYIVYYSINTLQCQ
jgi:hypothetical protein